MTSEHFWSALAIVATTYFVVACNGDDDRSRTLVFENSGPVCLTSENGMLHVRVSTGACVDNGCLEELSTACRANITSDRITINSKAVVLDTTDQRENCPAGCGPALAECSIALPADGNYTVVHGSKQTDVTIPLSGSVPLFAENVCD